MSRDTIRTKPKVLVAEDNLDHLELLTDALCEKNIVVGTDSKEGCMQLLAAEDFDLVVLDYNLKKKFSGFDILREITVRYPNLPVIMVTAYGNEELAVKVMQIGAKDYIRKSLDNNYIDRIVKNINLLLNQKESINSNQAKNDIMKYLEENLDRIVDSWYLHLVELGREYSIEGISKVPKVLLVSVFNAVLFDIKLSKNDSLDLIKELLFEKGKTKTILSNHLNLTFYTLKIAVRSFLTGEYTAYSNLNFVFLNQLDTKIDEINFKLSAGRSENPENPAAIASLMGELSAIEGCLVKMNKKGGEIQALNEISRELKRLKAKIKRQFPG
ncbi:MAG: response regulator [Spirochaetales bacterium]|nr:response regulator [Spirochaetales bacterium]